MATVVEETAPQVAGPQHAAAPWTLYTAKQRWGYLAVLFLVSASQFFDRNIMAVLLEPIKQEFKVSDAMLGLLGGFCFTLFYAIAGLPVARWADRGNRRTVIAVCLGIWSAMTVCCGLAHAFWQLLLARVGVGAGEAGGIPPAQSLLADYFPPAQRATAIAVFTGGTTAGSLLGFSLGGVLAAWYGWRNALVWAGLTGLALALLVRLTLAEPRQVLGFSHTNAPLERSSDTLRILLLKRSFRYVLAGWSLYLVFVYGALIFIPSFLMRSLGATLAEASLNYGFTAAIGSCIGTLGGGWLADRLGRRDVRWFAWLPALACAIAGPTYIVAFATESLWTFMILNVVGYTALAAGVPSLFTAIHATCGNRRRATAVALVYFSASLLGGGMGPVLAGALSDALAHSHGPEGLRYSLITMTTLVLVSSVLFHSFGRAMPNDVEE